MNADADAAVTSTARVVVMGVAGSGKSTVGRTAAEVLHWDFVDADDLHLDADRTQMASGEALRDDQRDLWIERVRIAMEQRRNIVVACSALRRRHRCRLSTVGAVRMFFLDVRAEELAHRLATRPAHFFSPSLLASQFATLEPVQSDEGVTVVDGDRAAVDVADEIVEAVLYDSMGSTGT